MASFYGCVDGDIHGTDRPVKPASEICPMCGMPVPLDLNGRRNHYAHTCRRIDIERQKSIYTDNLAAVDERVVHVTDVVVKAMHSRGIRI